MHRSGSRRSVRTATIVDTTDNLYHLNLSQDSGIESPEGSYGAAEIAAAIISVTSIYNQS